MPFINCPCGAKIEGDDGDAIAEAFRVHNDTAHADLPISERRKNDAYDAIRRTGGWDGERAPADDVRVRPLTPDLRDAYLRFFDYDAFTDNPSWASCYCMTYHVALPPAQWEERTAEQNRGDRAAMIERGEASGVLAFAGDRVVGWCNASPRSSLPMLDTIAGWESGDRARSGTIICFAIAPAYRGQGVARELLDGACDHLRERGFAFVEAFPPKEAASDARAYHGPLSLYLGAGFEQVRDLERYVMVRKAL